jgi:hypothetical protein
MGSFAELVTIPTIVPGDVLTAGAEGSSAWTTGKINPAARMDIKRPCSDF